VTGACSKRQRGFSLLEILLAFSILALSLGVLMQIYSDSARHADVASDQVRATSLAQTLLADAAIESPSGEAVRSGSFNDKFRWQVRIAPYEELAGSGDSNLADSAHLSLWQVTTTVAWTGPPERSVALTTLRAHPRQPR
jgi:general secretion pathway protein I